MTIRLAALGVGHWHSFHDAAYLTRLPALDGVSLVSLHDPEPGRAEAVAARLDPALGTPGCFTGLDALLAETRPDFVLALGRHDQMAATAHRLIDAGIPFLVEKPMGLDGGEVASVAAHAERAGVFAAVPLFQRYQPFVATARRMIAEGAFGPISHMRLRNIRPSSQRYVDWGAPWMLDPATAGGGCLRNVGLHGLDLFCHILGENAEVTGCQLDSRALGQPVEDYALVTLRSASGVVGTVEVGNTFPFRGPGEPGDRRADQEMSLSGRDALLTASGAELRTVTAESQTVAAAAPAEPPPLTLLRDTLAAWRAGDPPPVSAADCARAMALADTAYAMG